MHIRRYYIIEAVLLLEWKIVINAVFERVALIL